MNDVLWPVRATSLRVFVALPKHVASGEKKKRNLYCYLSLLLLWLLLICWTQFTSGFVSLPTGGAPKKPKDWQLLKMKRGNYENILFLLLFAVSWVCSQLACLTALCCEQTQLTVYLTLCKCVWVYLCVCVWLRAYADCQGLALWLA